MEPLFVYATFPNHDVAAAIAESLLKKKLIACANILPQIRSLYMWKGKMQDEGEVVMILKTTSERYDELEEAIVKAHPYDVPAIVALPIEAGHAPFLEWIADETYS
jgi:periplasmic divalent cation tolerance protein